MNTLYVINNISYDIEHDYDAVSKQSPSKLPTTLDMKQTKQKLTDNLVSQQTLQDHANTPVSIQKQKNRINEEKSPLNPSMNHLSTLDELSNQLNTCQKKQVILLKQIHQLTSQSKQISSFTFFVPFNSIDNSKTNLSLQQRKSSFIERSKNRIQQISSQKYRFHQRIIPHIKRTSNVYLQERQKLEYDRLCAMIIKQQNRQNAKIYGNLIKNQICHC